MKKKRMSDLNRNKAQIEQGQVVEINHLKKPSQKVEEYDTDLQEQLKSLEKKKK